MNRTLADLPTPALVVDGPALERNLAAMASALPGLRLRPHVKAHKCTEIAKLQRSYGHSAFACATLREMEGMALAGLGDDLLLANEVLDASRLRGVPGRVTLAVDSEATILAAVRAGIKEVLIDVNVGLPRCGCAPERAGALAALARKYGLQIRGVMGYEGHAVGIVERADREAMCEASMQLLLAAHRDAGGDVISAGGTGTYDHNRWATEIQAGSYALMDGAYGKFGFPFAPALFVWSSVISASETYAVADAGLKCFGMDHGNPSMDNADVWFLSDEHTTFGGNYLPKVGNRVRIWPAHVDPTVAYHERLYVLDGERIVDEWPIDLRGW